MLAILVNVLVVILVTGLILYLINLLPIEGRLRQIARVIVIVIAIIQLLRSLQVLTVF